MIFVFTRIWQAFAKSASIVALAYVDLQRTFGRRWVLGPSICPVVMGSFYCINLSVCPFVSWYVIDHRFLVGCVYWFESRLRYIWFG